MKVALVGNMNNNFFSLLRYLRDINIDAYLLLYANEQFELENDTWEFEKWKPYIKQSKIINGSFKSLFTYKKEFLLKELAGFDYYISNGFSPALFEKAGMSIDLFLPYSVGIEYTFFYNKSQLRHYISEVIFRILQKSGLKKSVKLLGSVDGKALSKANKLGVYTINLSMPMVYSSEFQYEDSVKIKEIIETMKLHSMIIFSHVSHFLKGSDGYHGKRNDIFIKAFAHYIFRTNDTDCLLIFLEYGPGVTESKNLIKSLGISKNVKWLQIMPRKEILQILKHIDLGVGELGGEMWGGTVWEFMASGKPFFQYVNLSNEKMSKLLNAPCPNFMNTESENEIVKVLTDFRANSEKYVNMGNDLKQWFDLYGGIGLAKVYGDILLNAQNMK